MPAYFRSVFGLSLMVVVLVALPPAAVAEGDADRFARLGKNEPALQDAANRALKAAVDAKRGKAAGKGGHRDDLTLKLRDLKLLRNSLSTRDRRAADRLLARPSDSLSDPDFGWQNGFDETITCGTSVCVHYLDPLDNPGSVDAATQSYAEAARDDADHVLQTYRDAGYRDPKGDGTSGGDSKLDVYIGDLGNLGLYGYCTSDDPNYYDGDYPGWDMSAFCVVDNDYDPDQFYDVGDPRKLLDVTLAHELFHAVQFAYDISEDGWLMEATATWAEDELYDDVNDNVLYLAFSPLSQSRHALDSFDGGFSYGAWVYFRYLSETFPADQAGLPTIIRSIWENVDAAATVPDPESEQRTSIPAVKDAIAAVGTHSFAWYLADFAAKNRHPSDSYEEGVSWRTFVGAPKTTTVLSPSRPSGKWSTFRVAQLASKTVQFRPSNLGAPTWKLDIFVDLPPASHGSAATALVFYKNGTVDRYALKPDPSGDAFKTVPFSSAAISRVQLVLTNASTRYTCWKDQDRSCSGTPLDDRRQFHFVARAVKTT